MEVAHRKTWLHNKAVVVLVIGFVFVSGLSLLISFNPEFSSRAVGALFEKHIYLESDHNSLGSIGVSTGSDSSQTGLGSATQAGDRFYSQMNWQNLEK